MSRSHAGCSIDCLAAVLRSDDGAIRHLSLEPASSVLEAATDHGVHCLLGRAMHNQKARREVSEELATALDGLLRREQGVELVRRGELRRVIEGFDVTGIPALLFKGAALAYTHYPFPHLRPRCDTDLLVRPGDRLRASGLLASLGYHRVNAVDRDAVLTQWMFEKPGIGRVVHTLDLHWHISNRPLFRDILSFDEF